MKQGLKALRIASARGPDGLSSRLLNHLAKLLPDLMLGAMQEITLYEHKPQKLSQRFLIFINKINTNKRCYKRFRLITLISNLLKITSRAISKRIEYAIVDSGIMSRSQFAYFRNKSADEIVRHIKDIIADASQLDNDNLSFMFFLLIILRPLIQ